MISHGQGKENQRIALEEKRYQVGGKRSKKEEEKMIKIECDRLMVKKKKNWDENNNSGEETKEEWM